MERNQERYTATIIESSRELSPREKLKFKDIKLHQTLKVALDPQVVESGGLEIDVKGYAIVQINNPKSTKAKEYTYIVIEDKDGNTYFTGSNSFVDSFLEIYDVMKDEPEEFKIKVYGMPSKNYESGFLTCSIAD